MYSIVVKPNNMRINLGFLHSCQASPKDQNLLQISFWMSKCLKNRIVSYVYPLPHHAPLMFSCLPMSCQHTSAGVHMMFVPLFCHPTLLHVLTKSSGAVGGSSQCSPTPMQKARGLVRKHVMVRVNSRPEGNRRLTVAASCLSCFVKAANLPFVAADRGDKQERKQRIFCHGTGSGQEEEEERVYLWGGDSSHEDLFCLHISIIPWEPGSVFIWTPIVIHSGVRFLSMTCTLTDVLFFRNTSG